MDERNKQNKVAWQVPDFANISKLSEFKFTDETRDSMFRKLESLKQDLGDGVSAFAQRTQEFFLNPYTIQEISVKDYELYNERYQLVHSYKTNYLFKTDKWFDSILENPRSMVDNKRLIFRIFRLPLQKETEAIESFKHFSVVLNELDIPILYSTNILQLIVNSAKKEPTWSSAHVAVDVSLKNVFSVNSAPTKHLGRTDCDSLGRSPLALAVKQNKKDMIEHLIHIGAPTSSQDKNGDTIYHYCLEMGDEGITFLQYLISHHREPDSAVNLINHNGETPLHIATRLNKEKFLHLLIDGAGANVTVDSPNGRVIHLLLKHCLEPKKRIELIEKILNGKGGQTEVDAQDAKYKGTPLHWARSKEDVNLLIQFGAKLEEKSFTDDRPLHIMIKKKRTDAAYSLILNGSEINRVGHNGNTALHFACEAGDTNLVKALILFGADFNRKNSDGKTAGLLAIENRKSHGNDDLLQLMNEVGSMVLTDSPLPCVSRGQSHPLRMSELLERDQEISDINENDNITEEDEITPDDIDGTAAQAKYNDDVTEHNIYHKRETFTGSRSKSMGLQSPRITVNIPRSKSLNDRDSRPRRRKKLRVLCLDGGGIRGLVLTQILLAIEQASGKRLDELFDYISGTSTGGMLALGVLKGLTSSDIQRFYLKLKDECFQGKRPYSEIPLESNLRELFGESKLQDFSHPRVLVTSVMADRQPADLYLFRSYVPTGKVDQPATQTTSGEELPSIDETNEYIWKAARCTGAAPSYFPAMDRFLDGGLASNNPTFDTLVEIQREINATKKNFVNDPDFEPEEIDVLVSIGTGNQPIVKSKAAEAIWPSSVLDAYKSISATVELAKMFVETVCEADRWMVQRSRTWCEMAGIKYFRLNPQLLSEVQLDETDEQLLFDMMWETKKYLNQNSALISEIVHRLK